MMHAPVAITTVTRPAKTASGHAVMINLGLGRGCMLAASLGYGGPRHSKVNVNPKPQVTKSGSPSSASNPDGRAM